MIYVGISRTKYMMDLYAENYNIPMKEIKEDPKKWSNRTCSLISRLSSVRVPTLSKLQHRFNTIPIKSQQGIFININKLILIFILGKRTGERRHFWKSRAMLENSHWFQDLLHLYTNKSSVELAKGLTCESMEQNRESRKRLTQICPIDFFFTKVQWGKMVFSTRVIGQL